MQRTFPARVPIWLWRAFMARISPGEIRRFNAEPVVGIDYHLDLDYIGDGIRGHRLDVLAPASRSNVLPVYVYFHGGGWTSGDKAALTKYCASQAAGGMVVVNVNYRTATAFRMQHILQDGNAALDWVTGNIARFGGDATRVVLGGDSAGGQIAALLAASVHRPELAEHYQLTATLPRASLRGLVQHCSMVDFSVVFERGFVLSRNFIRMLLPLPAAPVDAPVAGIAKIGRRARAAALRKAAAFLSPIEWLGPGFPPVLVTTSERDYFYRANLNFVAALRKQAVPVETLMYDRHRANAAHTWQQNARHPESQEVYRRLRRFVRRVTTLAPAVAPATR